MRPLCPFITTFLFGLLFTSVSSAQVGMAIISSRLMAIVTPSVQNELKVTAEQKAKLKTFESEFPAKHKDEIKKLTTPINQQERSQLKSDLEKEAMTSIGAILKPDQMQRLQEIAI